LGIYTVLEDKWYDLVDWLNQFVPVAGVVDSVDRVVPSFILFIAFLILLFVGIFAFVFVSIGEGIGVSFQAEVTVLSMQSAPIEGAVVSFSQTCSPLGDFTLTTNSEGKATFKACSDSAELRVSKQGYSTKTESISFENNKGKIFLSQLTSPQRLINVKVKDPSRKIIPDAQVFLLCVKGGKLDENLMGDKSQPANGFSIIVPSDCDSVQLKAVAEGFNEKKELLGLNEENKVINLERVDFSGTAVFEVDSNSGKKEAIILVTDELGKSDTVLIDSTGSSTRKYSSGKYSYTATLLGSQETGSFEITTAKTTEVKIFFDEVTGNYIKPIINGTALGVYLKILDGNTGIFGADVRVFYKKGSDVNIQTKLVSNYSGIVPHTPVGDSNNKTYYAIIKSLEYETKLVRLDLKTSSQEPQEIIMTKGGSTLKVNVIDDLNKPMENVVVSIWKSDFAMMFEESKTTDKNGVVEFKSLPNGTYKIEGKSTTKIGVLNSISVSSDKTVILKMAVGTGNVRFNLFNQGESANAFCKINKKVDSDTNSLIYQTKTTNGYIQASLIDADTKVYLAVDDPDFIYVESPVFSVKRGNQAKDVILYKESDLPNSNKVQMFLEGVYESNPWIDSESIADVLMPGQKYYFLFTLIAKNESMLSTAANVFVSPKDKNIIDANTKMFIEDAFSTRASIVQTSLTMNSSRLELDPLNPTKPVHAKQLNVYYGDVMGTVAFPVLVEVSVDSNAKGSTTLYWEGLAGDNKSILYSKDFVVGQKFCFGKNKCPELLFSNFIKWRGETQWTPVQKYYSLQEEEVYDLNVIVENLTDKEIGVSNIVGKINDNSLGKIIFNGDLNSVAKSVYVAQLDKNKTNFTLKALKVYKNLGVTESLEKGSELNDLNGNNFGLKFDIVSKEKLSLQVFAGSSANVIYSKLSYPMFYIKAFYVGSGKPSVKNSIWEVRVKGENSIISTGVTDENGDWIGQMDLSSYPTGTVLVFSATDSNNSIPASLEITLQDGFIDTPAATVADCITIKIGGEDIKKILNPQISAKVGSVGGSYTIDSNCTEEEGRTIIIKSDLAVTPSNRFVIKPNQPQTVSLSDPSSVVTQRSGLLGAYPMQIMQVVNKTKFNQIGFIDIIVTDDSSIFSIENPILDMRNNTTVSSKVINNQFTGRLDIYYPQMDIGTNSVGLSYTKPGVPETVKFNAVVKSHAIEAITHAYHYGSEITQSNRKNKCHAVTALIAPNDLIFTDLAEDHADDKITTLENAVDGAAEVTTPDADDRDPTKSMYTLPVPIQNKIRSELYPTSGTVSATASTKALEEKVQNASFSAATEADEDPYNDDESGYPLSPSAGDTYEIIPETAGSFNNSFCENKTSINSGCHTGTTATESDDESLDDEERADDEYEETEGDYASLCSRCEINYSRVRVEPFLPEDFDGRPCNSANGVAKVNEVTEGQSLDVEDGADAETGFTLNGSFTETVNVNDDNIWTKIYESVVGKMRVLRASGCHPCKVLYFGDWLGGLYTKGKKKTSFLGTGLFAHGGSTARLYTQDEYTHVLTYYNERVKTWEKEYEFKPKEGTVVRLEPRYEYSVDLKWSNIDELISEDMIDFYDTNKNVTLEETTVVPHGLVPFSIVNEGCGESSYSAPDPTNTLVEYRNGGLIYAQIPADTVPDGLRVFLKDGYIYAEYIGDDQAQGGNEINFSVSNVNLQGSEYAILTVRDWVNGEKVEKIFQVKLMGNPGNCFSLDGVAGLTGKEFAPRLLFDWNWTGISYDQCDSTNPSYTYCDATQFTISMFKRLELINKALIANDNKSLPKYASFYAYLIRDGYSNDFLSDFDNYYSTNTFASVGFNSTSDFTGYDSFITGGKIDYNLKSGGTNVSLNSLGGLPSGGLFRVEIETVRINPSIESLFNQREPNANIHVTFTLIKQSPNYNLFYETPFDGEVGKRTDNGVATFDRQGYGVSINQGKIPLTGMGAGALSMVNYSGSPLFPITFTTSNRLEDLMDQKVITYTKDGTNRTLEFNPMQPTPVVLRVTDSIVGTTIASRDIKAPYVMSGHDKLAKVDRSWNLLSSTLGNSGKCTDFSGDQIYSFIEQTNPSNTAEKYVEWKNSSKSGTVEIATTFFTPPTFDADNAQSGGSTALDILSGYANSTKLLTVEGTTLASGTGIQLNYFYDSDYTKYQYLKGIFDMIAEGKLCVSQSAATEMMVWWNKSYLNTLRDSVAYRKSNSCID
jgi:hypothetical protein